MNIFCVDSGLDQAFAELGHTVCSVRPAPGVIDVREMLAAHDFTPDLVFQQENLGDRVFLDHLDSLSCVKVFWAMDAHLNLHWHKYYARLFDVTFTPHVSFFGHVPPLWTPRRLAPLAQYGEQLPFRPHAERSRAMAFVGLDDAATRPLRSRFFRLLAPRGLRPVSGVDSLAMLEIYGDARIVPNESIGFEVNYRLIEAASAGACVLAPPVGDDQNRLYEPDREILVYENGLDLLEKLAFLQRRPDLAEQLGRAAWKRTQSCHLRRHRAQAILDHLAASGGDVPYAGPALTMALAQRGRNVRHIIPAAQLARLETPDDGEVYGLWLRCRSEYYPGEATERAVRAVLTLPRQSGREEAVFACLGHALTRGDLPLFRAFWSLLHQACPDAMPDTPASLYHASLLLADTFRRQGRHFQPGLRYDAAMLPETALEALLLASTYAEGDLEWRRRLARLTARNKTWTLVRLNALRAILNQQPDWRTRLEYGCVCLDAYDVATGVAALRQAMDEAARQGKEPLACSILKGRHIDPLFTRL